MEYKNKELWTLPMPHCGGQSYRDILVNTGGETFDVEKYIDSEIGKVKMEMSAHFITHPDPLDAEVLEYWRALGMTKTEHIDGETGDKWVSYVPDGITENAPMIVEISMNPYECETSGNIQFSAQNGIIYVTPYNHDPEAVVRVVELMKEEYPIDGSRVYISGFSYGGIMATWIGLSAPKTFAAVNCAGTIEPIFHPGQVEAMSETDKRRRSFGDAFAVPRMLTILDYALEAGKYGMPFILNTGLNELRTTVPLAFTPNVPLGGWLDVCKMRGFNMMLRVNGHKEFFFSDYREALESENNSVRLIGVPFDETWEQTVLGVPHYFGDIKNDAGETIIRYIGIDNLPHNLSPSSPALLWEYLSKFRRNTETGELIKD